VNLITNLHLVPRSGMRGAIPPLPLCVFTAWCLVRDRDNFTFIPCRSRSVTAEPYSSRVTLNWTCQLSHISSPLFRSVLSNVLCFSC